MFNKKVFVAIVFPNSSVAAVSAWEQQLQGCTSVVLRESSFLYRLTPSTNCTYVIVQVVTNSVPMGKLQAEVVLSNWTDQ